MASKSIAYLFAAALCTLLLGCGASEPEPANGSSKVKQAASNSRALGVASFTRLSPIEQAQKDYLDSYNDYVRLLRESGPQTLETLQALAIYQKNYQLYQMLLKANDLPAGAAASEP